MVLNKRNLQFQWWRESRQMGGGLVGRGTGGGRRISGDRLGEARLVGGGTGGEGNRWGEGDKWERVRGSKTSGGTGGENRWERGTSGDRWGKGNKWGQVGEGDKGGQVGMGRGVRVGEGYTW